MTKSINIYVRWLWIPNPRRAAILNLPCMALGIISDLLGITNGQSTCHLLKRTLNCLSFLTARNFTNFLKPPRCLSTKLYCIYGAKIVVFNGTEFEIVDFNTVFYENIGSYPKGKWFLSDYFIRIVLCSVSDDGCQKSDFEGQMVFQFPALFVIGLRTSSPFSYPPKSSNAIISAGTPKS